MVFVEVLGPTTGTVVRIGAAELEVSGRASVLADGVTLATGTIGPDSGAELTATTGPDTVKTGPFVA